MATPRVGERIARKAHVALFDATTPLAQGVKEHLVGRRFPIASVRLYTSRDDPESNLTEFNGEAMFIGPPDPEAIGPLDIAFLCGTRSEGERYLDWPGRRGFRAIDLTSASSGTAGVPIVNAAVNPEALADPPAIVGAPRPIALFLSTVLGAVRAGCGLREASAVVLQPVSESGEEGIQELVRQTAGLLNFQEVPREVFGRQIAFNLVPALVYGAAGAPGAASAPELEREVARVTGGGFGLAITVVLAPVFHGHSAMVRVVLPPGRGRADLEAALDAGREIDRPADRSGATPADRAGESGVLVAGPEPAGSDDAFWLWVLNDNLRAGAAQNAVRIAEAIWSRAAEEGS